MYDFDTNTKIVFDDETQNANVLKDRFCDRCGTALSDIKRDGFVGCANCYKVFENEIKSMILNSQGTIKHIGQIPSKHFSKVMLREKIAELEKEKDIAIQEENYIVAESIKNQIEKLKGEL